MAEVVVVETVLDGKEALNQGGSMVDKGAAAIGIDLHKVDEFFGLDSTDKPDKR